MYIYIYIYIYIYVYVCVCVCLFMCACTYAYVCVCVCVYLSNVHPIALLNTMYNCIRRYLAIKLIHVSKENFTWLSDVNTDVLFSFRGT